MTASRLTTLLLWASGSKVVLFFKYLAQLFLPPKCLVCGCVLLTGVEDYVCEECITKLKHADTKPNNRFEQRLQERNGVYTAFAGYHYYKRSPIARIVHNFKYNDLPKLAVYMGRELGVMAEKRNFGKDYDYLVPVPLHPKKKRERGYNQSERICAGISEIIGLEVREDILKRINNTSSQTEKSARERWEEIQGDYHLNVNPETLRGKRIILVDDIYTTGSTIELCCNELKKIPEVRVGVITVAKASY